MSGKSHEKWIGPIRLIQERICDSFGITMVDLRSPRRNKEFIAPRHVAMWLCRKLTMASLPAIGFAFGDRDHTTIIYGAKNAELMMARDQGLKEKTENIMREWVGES